MLRPSGHQSKREGSLDASSSPLTEELEGLKESWILEAYSRVWSYRFK
jgi:hypothetical protein